MHRAKGLRCTYARAVQLALEVDAGKLGLQARRDRVAISERAAEVLQRHLSADTVVRGVARDIDRLPRIQPAADSKEPDQSPNLEGGHSKTAASLTQTASRCAPKGPPPSPSLQRAPPPRRPSKC